MVELGLEPSSFISSSNSFQPTILPTEVLQILCLYSDSFLMTQEVFLDGSVLTHLAAYLDKHLQNQMVLYLENWGRHGTCNMGHPMEGANE